MGFLDQMINMLILFGVIFIARIPNSDNNRISPAQKVTYTFPEFPYKETTKNEVMFREIEAACERGCLGRNGVSKVLCIRQCVSPSCYRDLYQVDQLEEGEVDVRLNSFKGCFIQRYNRARP